jgi:enoyl-CoA hydratase
VGISHALDLFVTGKIVDGEEAHRIGLVNYLAKNKSVMETSIELAKTIAANGPIAVKQVKKAIMQGRYWNLPATLRYEAMAQAHCYGSDDFREGLNAVRTKSSPSFRGR